MRFICVGVRRYSLFIFLKVLVRLKKLNLGENFGKCLSLIGNLIFELRFDRYYFFVVFEKIVLNS